MQCTRHAGLFAVCRLYLAQNAGENPWVNSTVVVRCLLLIRSGICHQSQTPPMAVKSVALRGERRRDKAFYRSVQFELRHAELVSLLAGHLQ
jgi:hypothetical protein